MVVRTRQATVQMIYLMPGKLLYLMSLKEKLKSPKADTEIGAGNAGSCQYFNTNISVKYAQTTVTRKITNLFESSS